MSRNLSEGRSLLPPGTVRQVPASEVMRLSISGCRCIPMTCKGSTKTDMEGCLTLPHSNGQAAAAVI